MISYTEALSRLMAGASPITETETVPLLYSTGRILAEDVGSPVAVPAWDNSQMDGYAVRFTEATEGVVLPVSQRIPAGSVGEALKPGTVARIFTGAPVPEGADAVVPQEETEVTPEGVRFVASAREGAWIRRRGSDVAQGTVIASRGTRLTPAVIGVIASVGRAYVTVYRRLRVGVFFSGDELVQPGEPLPPGGIYNSNRYMLRSLLLTLGCEVYDLGSIPDSFEATKAALERAAETTDVILSTGGMSVGEEDHIKPAVESLGALDVWRVRVKPGKPLAFGHVKNVPFIGIPGNPVAAFVIFLMMARPFLLRRMGSNDIEVQPQLVRADFDWLKPGDREEFLRVRRNAEGGLDRYPNQNSQVLSSCAWGDGLVDVPAGEPVKKGDFVRYYPFCRFFA